MLLNSGNWKTARQGVVLERILKAVRLKRGGRPTKEQSAAMENFLLDGARASFCRQGVANATIDRIAAETGVSKHTVYRRFPNKGALLDAVVDRDMGRFELALRKAKVGCSDSLDALHKIALQYFEIGSSRDYAALYLSISAEAVINEELRNRLAGWSKSSLKPMIEAIANGQREGFIRTGDTQEICEVLVDLLEGANNRVRLGSDAAERMVSKGEIFEQRWSVFLTAMASHAP